MGGGQNTGPGGGGGWGGHKMLTSFASSSGPFGLTLMQPGGEGGEGDRALGGGEDGAA